RGGNESARRAARRCRYHRDGRDGTAMNGTIRADGELRCTQFSAEQSSERAPTPLYLEDRGVASHESLNHLRIGRKDFDCIPVIRQGAKCIRRSDGRGVSPEPLDHDASRKREMALIEFVRIENAVWVESCWRRRSTRRPRRRAVAGKWQLVCIGT